MSKIIGSFKEICKEKRDEIAFYYYERGSIKTKTFAEVENDIQICLHFLMSKNVKRGDRVLAFANSDYDLIIFIMATLAIGASLMYIDIFAQQDTLKSFFQQYQPQYILVSDKTKYMRFLFRIPKKCKVLNTDSRSWRSFSPKKISSKDVSDSDLALLTFTTGSTRKPRAVKRTHDDLMSQLDLIKKNMHESENKKVVLTTSYMYILANLLQGFTTVLPNLNLKHSARELDKKLNRFAYLPINTIITSPDFCLKTKNYYPNLKYLYFGGAILNLYEAKIIKEKFSKSHNVIIYGCTECNLISMVGLDEYINYLLSGRIGSLGRVVSGVNIRIGDNDEILISSKALLSNEDNYDIGDRGFTRDGILFYLGKRNNVFWVHGKKLYYNQVEQDLGVEFGLKKCALLMGRSARAFLFIAEQCDGEKIKKYIKKKYGFDATIKRLRKIPCDVKHHTKINYNKLEGYIK